jgi:hypothetical protein
MRVPSKAIANANRRKAQAVAIIEKPSGPSEIFASPAEAREFATPALVIPLGEFVESLEQPAVQDMIDCAAEHVVEQESS